MKFSAKTDPADLRRLVSKLDGIAAVARSYATANALTKAGASLRNEAIDKVKDEFPALRPSRIRKDIVRRRATPAEPSRDLADACPPTPNAA